jgi:hypothetical protein
MNKAMSTMISNKVMMSKLLHVVAIDMNTMTTIMTFMPWLLLLMK